MNLLPKRGYLKKAFTAAVAASVLALPIPPQAGAGSGPARAYAQDYDQYPLGSLAVPYKHETLASSSGDPVGVQLILAMDTSGSMTDEEFGVEVRSSAEAMNSALFRSTIKYKTGDKSIAVAVIDFESTAQLRISWVDLRGSELNDKPYKPADGSESSAAPDKLDALTREIINLVRRGSGGTSIHTATELSKDVFLNCPWRATERRVLDVFGDGSSSPVDALVKSRDELSMMGVTINGFAIVNDEPTLEEHYREYLITKEYKNGPGTLHSEPGRVWAVARNLQATGNSEATLTSFFGEVTRGMKQKISVEVAGIDDYHRIMALLNKKPDFPLPKAARP